MATLRFLFDGKSRSVKLPGGALGAAVAPATILSVARAYKVPLLSNCGSGDCGACLVEVEARAGSSRPPTEAEAFFLAATGRLDAAGGPGVHARLACQYRLGDDEDIEVRFSTQLGCL
ncbi:MAG: (2Fe-2S)-binding protein [Rhodospirillales bacterium]|nr:(2Fe-2S)-binding protein [Rhodospirillales bacterium]